MRLLSILLSLIVLLTPCVAQDFREDFETGTGGAFSYHKAPDDIKIERVQGQAASGQWYLRAVTAGKRNLEGYAITATGLTGARLAAATAKVRGKGELWLCLISGNGWLYSPQTTTLTDQWQEVSLSKALMTRDKTLGVYFITKDVQAGSVFEVDDVRVTLAPATQTADVEVGPWRLEAEHFSPNAKCLASDAQAIGGRMIQSEQYVFASGFPCPRTSKPIRIAARVRSGDAGDQWRLATRQGGNLQSLQTAKATKINEWEWLVFSPVMAGEVGDFFELTSQRGKDARGWVCIDSTVVATADNLSPEQLAAAPELLARRPMAAVGRDADKAGVTIGGFVGVGTRTASAAPTNVRLTYDDQALKLAFDCPEPLLDTAQQRRHEFLAKVTKRDGDLYEDDCVMILLQPAGSDRVYDFTVNALGTIMDAATTAKDLWGDRDLSWNSQAQARAAMEEKSWRVELAIPWSDLGGMPKVGDVWQASFARSAKGRKEQSAWNPTDKGVHDPVQFGMLVFGANLPAVQLQPPDALKRTDNVLAPAGTANLLTFAEIQTPGGITHSYSGSFDVPAEGEIELAYGALDAATLQPLVLTPLLPQGVKSSFANLTLACDGTYELFLNGKPIARGASASNQKIEAALEKGVNVFALRLQKGTAAINGQIGEWNFDGSGWALSPADAAGAMDLATDDGAWPKAPEVGKHPQLGPVVGEKDKPVILRRTVLFEKTRVWPTPEPVYSLAQGVAQHMVFRTEGLKDRKLEQWETYVAVPAGIEVLGSTGFYAVRDGIPRWTTTDMGQQPVQGKPMRVFKIAADQPLLTGRHHIMSEFQAFVRAAANPPEQCDFIFWSEANGGNVIEAPQVVKVQVLPKVNGAQCKTLKWQLWGGWLSNMDDLKMREQVFDCARAAGFNDVVAGDRWTSDNAPRYGLTHTIGVNYQSWSLNIGPYLKEHPDARLLDAKGKLSDMYMCTTELLGTGFVATRDALRDKLDLIRPNTVDYDYEYGPFAGPHSCYCDRCLAAFREHAKLPANAALTPESIAKEHRAQWVDFVARRVAKLFGMFRQTIHELSPQTHFSVYSGYATPDNAERYGVDWRYVGEEKGCDHAGCGYGRPVEATKATIEALKGIPLVCGLLLTPYERDNLRPANALTKAWILRTLLDSTGGVLVYERTELDGRSWVAMGEATRLAAEHEGLFLHGKHLPVPGVDPAQGEALQQGNTTLVLLMNTSGKPVTLKTTLPAEWGNGTEFYSGNEVAAGAVVEALLEPGNAQALVLTK